MYWDHLQSKQNQEELNGSGIKVFANFQTQISFSFEKNVQIKQIQRMLKQTCNQKFRTKGYLEYFNVSLVDRIFRS